LVIELFLSFIFYQYYTIEEEHLQENLFLEMKNYSLSFEDDEFDIDIITNIQDKSTYELYHDVDSFYILVPLPNNRDDFLKIYYPFSKYQDKLQLIQSRLLWQLLFLSFVSMVISFGFSTYILSPLRGSLKLLEVFIKDIIHDLNTPLSSILINLQMMDRDNQEVKAIKQSANTISMLHHNLDAYLRESKIANSEFDIQEIVDEQIEFFATIYDYLHWEVEMSQATISSDRQAFSRIIYNLLNNACRYNTKDGFIKIRIVESRLVITNSSYGIKNPHLIFERFYKESERGLGIGLHIVDKLSSELSISTDVEVDGTTVSLILDFIQVTHR